MFRNKLNSLKALLSSKYIGLLAGVVVFAVMFMPKPVSASLFSLANFTKDAVLDLLGWAAYFLMIMIGGWLATAATRVLVYVAQLNHFTNLPVIVEAWTVVRDLANMFFIVILLVVAFGTLFRIEAYSWKKLLPKMVLAAILVNFSRAICGVIVDASQVIMLTFVAAIKDAATVGLAEAFNLSQITGLGQTTLDQSSTDGLSAQANNNPSQRLIAIVAAGFMLLTMLTVQCVYIVILVGRMVMIWFLTVLSPLAYVMRVLPQTERYSSQWWELFGRYVTVGPLAMFFLWLAMFIAAKSIEAGGLGQVAAGAELANLNPDAGLPGAAELFSQSLLAGFVIATLMLMAGMKLALENSSELGAATGKAADVGKFLGRAPLKLTQKGVGYLNDKQAGRTGYDFNLVRSYHSWQHGLEKAKRWRENQIASTAGIRQRQGNILAGVLGAGDQMAEGGLTVLEDHFRGIGVAGTALNVASLATIGLPIVPFVQRALNAAGLDYSKEAAFRRALSDEQSAQRDKHVAQGKINSARASFDYLRTNTDYETELSELDAASAAAAGVQTAYSAAPAGTFSFDMSDNDHREMIDEEIQRLQAAVNDGTKTDAQRAASAAELSRLTKGKEKGRFTETDIGMVLGGVVAGYAAKKASAYTTHAADRARITDNGRLHSRADIETFIGAQQAVIDAKKEFAEAEAAEKDAEHRRHIYEPRMGGAWELKFRKSIAEEAHEINTTDASALLDGFVDAVKNGKGTEACAWYEKLCATGNDNEPYKHYGLSFDIEGAKGLAKILQERTGLSEQAVLSTMYRGAQLSESAGHTPVAQMFDNKGGEIVWRSTEAQIAIAKGEEAKKSQRRHQTDSTRLRNGEMSPDSPPTPIEIQFYERTIRNVIPTSDTNGKSHTNPNWLSAAMNRPDRWAAVKKETIRILGETQGKEAIKRLEYEARTSGISIPS